MEVNNQKLKALREQKGWTQAQLAEMCDVSLRTIQRVEKLGTASQETVAALCAVLEIDRSELSVIPRPKPEELKPVYPGRQSLQMLAVGFMGVLVGVAGTYLVLH